MDISTIQLNWVDLATALIIITGIVGGINRGFILGVLDLIGFFVSFFLAIKLYPQIGSILLSNFAIPRGIANALGFLLAGFVIEAFFSALITLVIRKIFIRFIKWDKHKNLYKTDKFLGIIPAAGETLVFTAFILTLIVTLPVQGSIKRSIVTSYIGGNLVSNTQGIEHQINAIFGDAVNETLTFLTINASPGSTEKVELGFTQNDLKIDESSEATMLLLVNQERQKMGLKPLTISTRLRTLARDYAQDMFRRGFFSHYNPEGLSPFERMANAKIVFGTAGENLALAPNVFLAHQGLMNSPGHRANILLPDFTQVGIGVIDGGMYGEMFVQEFTD